MSDRVIVDGHELSELVHDLRGAGLKVALGARPIIARAALNVKQDWQQRWEEIPHIWPLVHRALSYDLDPAALGAEIGPDKNRPQGALGNVIEYGTSKNPPHPAGAMALAKEAPNVERFLAELAGKIL